MQISIMVAETHDKDVEIEYWDCVKNLSSGDSLDDLITYCKRLQPGDYVEYLLSKEDMDNKTYVPSLRVLTTILPEHNIDAFPRRDNESPSAIYFHVSDIFEKIEPADEFVKEVQEVYLPVDIAGNVIK